MEGREERKLALKGHTECVGVKVKCVELLLTGIQI